MTLQQPQKGHKSQPDSEEAMPFDDALLQILKAPPKKSPKSDERSKPPKPPKRGKKA